MYSDRLIQLSVPCSDCKMCCMRPTLALVIRDPEEAKLYDTFINENGEHEITRKPNGECVYLGAKGCSIYEKRSTTCSDFDCRGYAVMNSVGEYDKKISEKGKQMIKESGGLKVFAEYLTIRENKEANKVDVLNVYNVLVERSAITHIIDAAICYFKKYKSRHLFVQSVDKKVQRSLKKLSKHKHIQKNQTLCAISAICRDKKTNQGGSTFITKINFDLLNYLLQMQIKDEIDDLVISRIVLPLAKSGHPDAIDCYRMTKR